MLKIVRREVIKWFENHPQINSVYYLNDSDFNAIENKEYKSVQIDYISTSIGEYTRTHNFNISICDQINPNINVDDDVISDCVEILSDFFGYLMNVAASAEFWSDTTNGLILPFYDDDVDRTSGATSNFSITTNNYNTCYLPITPF